MTAYEMIQLVVLVTCGGYLLVLAIALLAILFGVGIE